MEKVKNIFKIFIILLILQNVANRKKSRSVYFLDIKNDMNPKFVKYLNINISQDKTSMNILMETNANITQVWGATGISVWKKSSRAYRSIFSYDMDVCETLRRLKSVKMELLNKWILNILKYGNISNSCPFLKNVYYIDNMKVDRNSIPGFAPAGKFQTSVLIYRKDENELKEIIGTSELTFELK